MPNIFVMIFLSIFVSSCSKYIWYHPERTERDIDMDYEKCMAYASGEMRQFGVDPYKSKAVIILDKDVSKSKIIDRSYYFDLIDRCMERKGYARVKKESIASPEAIQTTTPKGKFKFVNHGVKFYEGGSKIRSMDSMKWDLHGGVGVWVEIENEGKTEIVSCTIYFTVYDGDGRAVFDEAAYVMGGIKPGEIGRFESRYLADPFPLTETVYNCLKYAGCRIGDLRVSCSP